MNLAKLIIKLYPAAIEVLHKDISRRKLDDVRNLLVLGINSSYTFIRVGDVNDGGYVLVNDIDPNDVCLSFGIGANFSFDLSIAQLCSEVRMFDHTIEKPKHLLANMTFNAIGLASDSKEDFVTLTEVLADLHPSKDIILKIDIEGDEWDILQSLSSQDLLRFKQIALELHGIHEIGKNEMFTKITKSLQNLNSTHVLVNIHTNNWGSTRIIQGIATPDVIEVTYVRKKEAGFEFNQTVEIFPALNNPNNGDLPEAELSFISRLRI